MCIRDRNEASESVKYTDQEIPYEVESSKDVKVLEDGFKVSRNGGSITLKVDGLDVYKRQANMYMQIPKLLIRVISGMRSALMASGILWMPRVDFSLPDRCV